MPTTPNPTSGYLEIVPLENLGMPEAVNRFTTLKRGLVLVTGPTGSGKSTTLAAMLNHRNENAAGHILTIEDPIEYLHKHKKSIVNQREIGSDTASFSEALRRVLRQDPDIILVGEMRDLETVSTAISAAETGHLVMASPRAYRGGLDGANPPLVRQGGHR
mgnify:CR=1 FL=1